jgi:hypothetical protein
VVRARIDAQRGAPPVGDVRAAIRQLIDHYEAEGRLVWHLLRQEQDVPLLAEGVAEGRRTHRAWVGAVFGLADHAGDRIAIDRLVGATDLFLWKLWRIDLKRSRAEVEAHMLALVGALQGANTTVTSTHATKER